MRRKVSGGVPRAGAFSRHRDGDSRADAATRSSAARNGDPLAAVRQEAGRRYAAAVTELLDVYADLAAVEGAMSVNADTNLRTFGVHQALMNALAPLRHREFVRELPKDPPGLIADRRTQLLGE